MFWLVLNNGAVVVVFLFDDAEVGWRISSKKLAKIINKNDFLFFLIKDFLV